MNFNLQVVMDWICFPQNLYVDASTLKAIQGSSGLPLPPRAQGPMLFPPRFQAIGCLPTFSGLGWSCHRDWSPSQAAAWVGPLQRTEGAGPPCRAVIVTLPLHSVCLEDRSSNQRGLFCSLKIDGIYLNHFWTCLRWVIPFLFPTSPFWNGNVHLFLSHHCIVEACKFSDFTGSQL